MQKVNVYAQYPKGGSYYKSVYATESTTINDILSICGLHTIAASVYLNSVRLNKQQLNRQISSFKIKGYIFLSLRYGEQFESRKAGL